MINITRILMCHPESDYYFLVATEDQAEEVIEGEPLCHIIGDVEIKLSLVEGLQAMLEFKKMSMAEQSNAVQYIKELISNTRSINDLSDVGAYIKDLNLDNLTNETLRNCYVSKLKELKNIEEMNRTGKMNGLSI